MRGKHSEKPDVFYELVMQLLGDFGPRIDLFARKLHTGWDAWGNEIAGLHHEYVEVPRKARSTSLKMTAERILNANIERRPRTQHYAIDIEMNES